MTINLSKGQKIDLTKKDGGELADFCVGVNWGMIAEKSFFGKKEKKVAVDLDASCAFFKANNELVDVVYYGQLKSKDGSVKHSGDDREGDADGDDGLDNEVISVNLKAISSDVDKVVFFLNSYKQQDFSTIPFASIRLYEGTAEKVQTIHAQYDVARDETFKGCVSMVLGKLYRRDGKWKFGAIGEPTKDSDIKSIITTIERQYL